ncbi:MAG: MotA/TolQ/ExbB proton channel family protein [Planctomycetota bacterium]
MARKSIAYSALTVFIAAFVVLATGAEALAQEAAQSESYLKLISYGGIIGYFTIFLNFVGIGFAIEHFINIRRDILMPPEVLSQVEAAFDEGEYEEALAICESQPNYFARVMVNSLPLVGTGFENIERAAERSHDEEATRLFTKIGHINFIANIAPMTGLLGTVSGMMVTFATLAASETPPKPSELAGGIQQAIVTTVLGLCVNIPMSFLFYFFRVRVINLVREIGESWRLLIERFRD